MARRIRIAALGSLAAGASLMIALGGVYYAAQQVRPFYERALRVEPEALQRGRRELESRATALYSDARQLGKWQAIFTADQINGWLATQLADKQGRELPANFRDPRVAIAPGLLTLGFRTKSRGVDTVISVDAAVSLTDDGAVAIRLMSVRAGALPLPVLPLADELATACKNLSLPVRWTQQDGLPVAVVEIRSDDSTEKRQFHIDAIELGESELYLAGRTEIATTAGGAMPRIAGAGTAADQEIEMADYELRLTPRDKRSALTIARRTTKNAKARKPAAR
jgi:hypothetical protein